MNKEKEKTKKKYKSTLTFKYNTYSKIKLPIKTTPNKQTI